MHRLSLVAAALLLSAGVAQADIYGLYATPKNNGRVEVVPCDGGHVCARIVDGKQIQANPNQADVLNPDPAKRKRLVKGLYILVDYSGGPDKWSGGTVYDPQTGDASSDSTIERIGPDTLKVTGCRLVFCRTETWTRLSN